MKNSGVEWIGEIPDDWESIRLKYIYSTTKAKLPKQFYDDKNLTPRILMLLNYLIRFGIVYP